MSKRYIGIEAGGTKFVCAHGSTPDDIDDRIVIPTTTPSEVMPAVIDYIHQTQTKCNIDAIGLATFGPVNLDRSSHLFGHITTTPKIAWQHFDILTALSQASDLPIEIDLDVNGSALGEEKWGAAKGLENFLYMTVGTGIGVAAVANGQLIHGMSHPSMGHIVIHHDLEKDPYPGSCPYHHDCLEGLASGFAMCDRWQVSSAGKLDKTHPAWDLETDYLTQAVINYTNAFWPQRLIIGGGVMHHEHLLPRIASGLVDYFAEFKEHLLRDNVNDYLVRPALGNNSGILGAFILAENATRIAAPA